MWVSSFGYLRIVDCLRLLAAFRSLPRPSSAPSAKAFALSPFYLDLVSLNLSHLHDIFSVYCINLIFGTLAKAFLLFISMSRSLIHQIFCSLRRKIWELVANDLPSIFFSFTVEKIGLGHLFLFLFSYAIFKVLFKYAPPLRWIWIKYYSSFAWVAIKQHKSFSSP